MHTVKRFEIKVNPRKYSYCSHHVFKVGVHTRAVPKLTMCVSIGIALKDAIRYLDVWIVKDMKPLVQVKKRRKREKLHKEHFS